jgi:RNA polymerase sigma-70 factor (ECF subfamily)
MAKEAVGILWRIARRPAEEFEEVALVHLDALYGLGLRLTHNRAEAEDLVQEAYLRAFKSFHRFNPGTNCRAWLFTILRNVFLNRIRRSGREVLEGDARLPAAGLVGLESPGEGGSPEEEFFQTVLHGDVERALKTLPLPFREAVVLADLEGLSYREVAQVLGCPIGTVMSRLSRGRALLRRALGQFAREHGYTREDE